MERALGGYAALNREPAAARLLLGVSAPADTP